MPLFLTLFLFAAATASAQNTCPRVVPARIDLTLPATLPPGPYPYVENAGVLWVFCDSATTAAVPFTVTTDGPLSVFGESEARSETSESYLWPTLTVSTMSAAPRAARQEASITITAAGGSATVPVSITYTDLPFTYADDLSLGFDWGNPQDKKLTLWFPNAAAPVPFSVAIENAPWLTATPVSGAGYAELSVRGDLSNLSPASYFGSVVITARDAVNSPLRVPVRTFIARPGLMPFPTQLSFSQVIGGAPPAPQTVQVTSRDYQMAVAFTTSTDAPWLSVTPSSGTAAAQATVTVSVNGTGLAVGTYHASAIFTASGAVVAQVPVSLTIFAENSLIISPDSFSLVYWPNIESTIPGGRYGSASINIKSTAAPLKWRVTKQNSTGFLGVTYPDSGTTPSTYSFSWSLPAPGTYADALVISSEQANNSPQIVPVTFKVLTAAPVQRTPERVDFQSQKGSTPPPPQTVSVTAAEPTSFTVSAASDGDWLSVTPDQGTTPATFTVSVRIAGLAPGNYVGVITLAVAQPDGSTIPVGMIAFLQIFS